MLELGPGGDDHLLLRVHLAHWDELMHVAGKARRIANLDADMGEPTEQLAGDPVVGPLLRKRPGLRVPGTWDPYETGVRAILGQQVSVAGANTLAGRLVERLGTPVPGVDRFGLTHTFPSPATLAEADLSDVGLTGARAAAVRSFARAVAEDAIRLDRSVGLDRLVASIQAIDGLGPWTAHYIALRLGERDAWPATDLGLRRALASTRAQRRRARSPSVGARGGRSRRRTSGWPIPPRAGPRKPLGGGPVDEPGRADDELVVDARVVDAAQEELRHGLGHHLERLTHRRQRRVGGGGVVDVVEADHGDVVGHAPAEGLERLERADRHRVVGDEDAVERRVAAQQRLDRARAGLLAEVAVLDQALPHPLARVAERVGVALETVDSHGHVQRAR